MMYNTKSCFMKSISWLWKKACLFKHCLTVFWKNYMCIYLEVHSTMVAFTPWVIVSTICFVISTFIFLPLEIWYMRKFWLWKASSIIIKRRPSLVISGIICNQSFHTLYFGMSLILSICRLSKETAATTTFWILIHPLICASFSIYIARLWLIYFDINMNVETMNNKWQSIIDPISRNQQQWYRLNKSKYGTWRKVRWYLLGYVTFLFILIATAALLWWIPDDTDSAELAADAVGYTAELMFWSALIFLWVLLCKIPKIHDNIGMLYCNM